MITKESLGLSKDEMKKLADGARFMFSGLNSGLAGNASLGYLAGHEQNTTQEDTAKKKDGAQKGALAKVKKSKP